MQKRMFTVLLAVGFSVSQVWCGNAASNNHPRGGVWHEWRQAEEKKNIKHGANGTGGSSKGDNRRGAGGACNSSGSKAGNNGGGSKRR